jgi:hypothetical protein
LPKTTAAACASVIAGGRLFAKEPPRGVGALGDGEKAYVDDGECPAGTIKQIIGGRKGVGRKIGCVRC